MWSQLTGVIRRQAAVNANFKRKKHIRALNLQNNNEENMVSLPHAPLNYYYLQNCLGQDFHLSLAYFYYWLWPQWNMPSHMFENRFLVKLNLRSTTTQHSYIYKYTNTHALCWLQKLHGACRRILIMATLSHRPAVVGLRATAA